MRISPGRKKSHFEVNATSWLHQQMLPHGMQAPYRQVLQKNGCGQVPLVLSSENVCSELRTGRLTVDCLLCMCRIVHSCVDRIVVGMMRSVWLSLYVPQRRQT